MKARDVFGLAAGLFFAIEIGIAWKHEMFMVFSAAIIACAILAVAEAIVEKK